ncbi:hypothetical protein [Acetobacter sp.]|uniref:hypothetical protein n=1 Tax=Acetobacter sp. TaxID=440 RepID=UPI0039E9DABF
MNTNVQRFYKYFCFVFYILIATILWYALYRSLPVMVHRLLFNGILEHAEPTSFYLSGILREKYPLYQYFESSAALYQTGTIYNPLYYLYLRILPEGWISNLSVLRIVSFVPPFLLSVFFIEIAMRRALNLRWVGLIWGVIFCALYPMYGWVDLSRPDAFFMFSMVMVFFFLSLEDKGYAKFVLVGLSICISFLIKQPGLILIFIPLILSIFERKYLISCAVALVSIVFSVVFLRLHYGPAYWMWVFVAPGHHPFSLSHAILVFAQYTGDVAISLAAPFIFLLQARNIPSKNYREILPLFLICAAALVLAFISSGKEGGWVTDFIIFMNMSSIIISAVLSKALQGAKQNDLYLGVAVSIGILVSISVIEARSARHSIKPLKRDLGQIKVEQIVRHIKGDVWTTTWPIIDYRAGKSIKSPLQQLCQAWLSACSETHDPGPGLLDPAMWNDVFERKFEAILLPNNLFVSGLSSIIKNRYIHCFSLQEHEELKYYYGQMYWPSEVWVASQATCDDLRMAFGY